MSVANVTMFEFQTPESMEEFASWYKGHGTYPNNDISLFVRTGETSAIGISVYTKEDDRQHADNLRNDSASTELSRVVKEIIPLSGDVLIHFLKGKLLEQSFIKMDMFKIN